MGKNGWKQRTSTAEVLCQVLYQHNGVCMYLNIYAADLSGSYSLFYYSVK